MNVSLGDFSPDLDSTTPGIVSDANWVYRVKGGWAAIPPMMLISKAALPSQCYGAIGIPLVAGGYQIVAGVNNQLYQLDSSNQFVSAGLTLTGGTNPWSFALYGSNLIAVNGIDTARVSSNGGAFSLLGGSPPILSIVEATDFSLFGINANSNSGTFTFNAAIWTPDIATLCGTFSLTSTPGNITAARQLRAGIGVYKEASLFFGAYTANPSELWQFTNASRTVGCKSQDAVVAANNLHYFPGPDDFYVFDGYNVTPIPNNLRNWWQQNLYAPLVNLVRGVYDSQNNQILWWFPTDGTGALNTYISLSLGTGYWSKGILGVDAPVPLTPAPSSISTQFGAASTLAVILNSHSLGVSGPTGAGATYASGAPYVTSGDLGDKQNIFTISRVRPGLLDYPVNGATNAPPANTPVLTPKLSILGTYIQGQDYVTQIDAAPISQVGYYDVLTANRLQRLKFLMSTGFIIADAEVELDMQGSQ